jgi:hypothetical protein
MSTPSPADVLQVPGKLSKAPTNLATAYPHGGTALGEVRAVVVRPSFVYGVVRAAEFGNEPVEAIATSEAWVLAGVLRSYDPDALSDLFPNTALAGSGVGGRIITYPGTVRTGHLLSSRSIKLLFTPDDSDRQPAVLFYRALPMLDETAELRFTLADKLEFPFVFAGIRDASNRIVAIGRLRGLTL